MDWLKEYKDYFILATAIATLLGLLITYIFNRSLKQQEAFNERTEESIKTILGPMTKILKNITEEEHEQTRLRKLERFIEKYDGIESPLFLSPSRDLLKQFDFVVEEYKIYKKNASQENYNALWASVLNLQELSNRKFEDYTNFIFRHYDWKYQAGKKNIILRLLIHMFKLAQNIVQGLSKVIIYLSLYVMFVDLIFYLFRKDFLIKPYLKGHEIYILYGILLIISPVIFNIIDIIFLGSKSKKNKIIKRDDILISSHIRKSPHLFLHAASKLDESEPNKYNEKYPDSDLQ